MSLLFGLRRAQFLTRLLEAAVSIVINFVLWFQVPTLLLQQLEPVAGVPVEAETISGFALAIIGLGTLKTILRHHAVGAALGAGGSLVSAVYVFVIAKGGQIVIPAGAAALPLPALTLRFETLLWLSMLAPLLNAVANVWQFVEQVSSRPASLHESIET